MDQAINFSSELNFQGYSTFSDCDLFKVPLAFLRKPSPSFDELHVRPQIPGKKKGQLICPSVYLIRAAEGSL